MVDTKNIDTEGAILEAAKRIFQKKGMNGARMQEIADEASINKSMLHYYYRSKQLLFEAVFKKAFSMLAPKLNEIINAEIELFDKINLFSFNFISFVIKHPYLPNFIIQELNRNPEFIDQLTKEDYFPSIDNFKKQVEKDVASKKIRSINAEQLFINILALNIFPFVGGPLLKGFTGADEDAYSKLMQERKTEVSNFIINAIKI